ncbi:ubiquitin-ubiquitin ligase HUL5 PWA37_002016 [Arxiozyma heterogenica]|uniref:HECT-type E3 ubiquitin transferase n=1 Tax=Arxiozyma heterogenica TaxID=278026 RepID=A0AAN7WTN9_9SACH|nr:hypothetical protein RI543_001484 [Kazachstania heterogenica]
MLNFGGQTRRRVINLGTKNRSTTKKDILQRAEQERKRRAENREKEEAIRTIQKFIRKRLDLKRFLYSPTCANLNTRQQLALIILFKSKLFAFGMSESDLNNALLNIQNSCQLYEKPYSNNALIDILGHLQTESCLINILRGINLRLEILNMDLFINNGVIPFLKNVANKGALSSNSAEALCQFLSLQKISASDPWLINFLESIQPDYNLFCSIVKYKLFPKNFQNFHNGSFLLNNMCYILVTMKSKVSDEFYFMVFDIINHLDKATFCFLKYSSLTLEKSFIEKILSCTSLQDNAPDLPLTIIDNLLQISKYSENRNNILMILLAKQSLNMLLYESLMKLNLHNKSNITSMPPAYRITKDLTRLYLQFATDADLLSNSTRSYLSLPLVTLLTKILKEVTFNTLWNSRSNEIVSIGKTTTQTIDNILFDIKDDLSLLTQLYLRDSRGYFFSRTNKSFWCATDESFIDTNIYPILIQYEELFQQEMNIGISSDIYEKRNVVLEKLLKEKYHGIMSRPFRKLNILIKSPFFIPFNQRVDYFYFLIETDKHAMGYDNVMNLLTNEILQDAARLPMHGGSRSATISREHVLEDAMDAYNYGSDLKSKLSVTFVNQFGREEGIDGGGVTKEFLTSVIEEGFKDDSKYKLFNTNELHEIYPKAITDQESLKIILFLGKIVGKCLYDHILVDLKFANFFLKLLLIGVDHLTIDDLRSLDRTLYDNLISLLDMSDEELTELDLTFETMNMFYPEKIVELIPNGSEMKVNKQNVLQYVWKLAHYKLVSIAKPASYKFLEGLGSIIPQHWFGMFNTVDFQMLISGGHKPVDIEDLRTHTEYGGYDENDSTIKYFWEVLEEFNDKERRDFLRFVTSVPQAPLKGFSALEPKFGIRNGGKYELDRLPTASTCVNLLKLPDYGDKTVLKQKLLYAINAGARFDLS